MKQFSTVESINQLSNLHEKSKMNLLLQLIYAYYAKICNR